MISAGLRPWGMADRQSRWDLLAATSAVLALVMLGLYLGIIAGQGGDPAWWFVLLFGAAALLAAYGSMRRARGRRWLLGVAGVVMVGLGLLAILSIGCPIVIAGAFALGAALRGRVAPLSRPH